MHRLNPPSVLLAVATNLLAIGWVSTATAATTADEDIQPHKLKFALGIAAGAVRFDTNGKYTEHETGRSVFIDAEGTLDLPEWSAVPLIYGMYRITPKHSIGFSYSQVDRESTVFSRDFKLDDLLVRGEATLRDRTRFFYLSYGYTFFQDNRSYIIGEFGIYGLDLRYEFEAEGDISFDGTVIEEGRFEESANVLAPLPLFALDFRYEFTRTWGLSTKIAFVGGRYQDIAALVVSTRVAAIWQFSRHVGLIMGIEYFDGEVDIDDEQEQWEINYGYTGMTFGLHVAF